MRKETLSGWGRNIWIEANVAEPQNADDFRYLFKKGTNGMTLRGLGRSYGDSSLGRNIVRTIGMDRLISFDAQNGILECESGVILSDILKIFVARGWFPPVTPGTRYVTIGGMLASDVHGKNHHMSGSFSRHVLGFNLLTADGEIRWVDRQTDLETFLATAGGMGLTGAILTIRFRMIPIKTSWISQKIYKLKTLTELLEKFETTKSSNYSVAWIDCLAQGNKIGRSLLILGEHAIPEELPASKQIKPLQLNLKQKVLIPFDFPGFMMNRWSVKIFNTLYYNRIFGKKDSTVVSLIPFFYPLDTVHDWNRIYGKKGFYQYQCVLPKKSDSEKKVRELLKTIALTGEGSFLAVLKLFGPGDDPYLSFAKEGYTLALDFPIRLATLDLLARLDSIVRESDGCLYLTKDSLMDSEFFQQSYPKFPEFMRIKRRIDPKNQFTSKQAERLGLIS